MKQIFTVLILPFLFSCNSAKDPLFTKDQVDTTAKANDDQTLLDEDFSVDPAGILKDLTTWYEYTYYNVRLSQDFTGLGIDSVKIDKTTFLNQLMTGKVVAFKTRILQGLPVYKLYTLDSKNESIRSTIKQLASIEMKNFKMEGKQIPEFNFTDINGENYSASSTKGKLLVLKCWFIHCVACVREFPECNELVDENKDNNDILFVSLARNQKKDLAKFLETNPFKYAVIPDTDNYMPIKLDINQYPTHLLIGRDGKILKVVNSIDELKPFLEKEKKIK